MPNERDTHFAGFAKLLYQDICDELGSYWLIGAEMNEDKKEAFLDLIACRAYDLVYFLLDNAPLHSGSFDVGYGGPDQIHETIGFLPDLTAWPESET